VAVCPDLAATPLGLCSGHESPYRTQGRPGGAALPQAWSRSYERQDLPVPVSHPRRHTPRLLAADQAGLTVHGLTHAHKTGMAEDGIPGILAEQRLGHQVPGMRGLYTHASDRMRDESTYSRPDGKTRSTTAPSPRARAPARHGPPTQQAAPGETPRHQPSPGEREEMISQILPSRSEAPMRPGWGYGENRN
jgi:hypothetical protein